MKKSFFKIILFVLPLALLFPLIVACTPETPPETPISVESVSLNLTSLTLEIGESDTLIATVLPENADDKTVTWTSLNPEIATVSNGLVTAIKEGATSIVVTTTDGGKTAICTVIVTTPEPEPEPTIQVQSVSLNTSTLSLTIGQTDTLVATVLPENATDKSVTWTSLNPEIATVSNGLITAIAEGATSIVVTTTDGGKTAICTVIVNIPEPEECSHDWELSSDQSKYVCSICDDVIPSGAGSLGNNGSWNGTGFDSNFVESLNFEQQNYLFVGSSLANGYHTATNPNRVSMANMLREDYLTANFTVFENGNFTTLSNVYMRKISTPVNAEGVEGKYRWDSYTVELKADNTGTFNGVDFEYFLDGSYVSLKFPTGTLFGFEAIKRGGDKVYKYTSDGNSISAYATSLDPLHDFRYVYGGEAMNMWTHSIGYEGSLTKYERSYVCQLLDAIYDIGNKPIDKVFIQLSTNDIGQYTTSSYDEHLPFGTVLANNIRDIDSFDITTSFGALEYMVAKIKQQWPNAEVVIFSCWMMDSDWALYQSSGKTWDDFVADFSDQSNYDNVSEYAKMRLGLMQIVEKWDTHFIDAWADYEANRVLNENHSIYKSDTVHMYEAGYERVAFPAFRELLDKVYNKEEA